jgi:hypothetical protein
MAWSSGNSGEINRPCVPSPESPALETTHGPCLQLRDVRDEGGINC